MKNVFEIKVLPIKGVDNWVYITQPKWRLWLIKKLIGSEQKGGHYGRK